MKRLFIKIILNTASLALIAYFLDGISFEVWQSALIAGLILGLLNAFLRPLIVFITLPINILTLGLFTFIINGFLLYLSAKIVPGFYISNFTDSVLGAVIFSLVSFILNFIFKPKTNKNTRFYRSIPQKNNYIDIKAETIDEK